MDAAGFVGAGEDELEEDVFAVGLDAIADVERRFKGRGGFGLANGGGGMLELGGEIGISGLGVCLPLLCADGGFDADLGEDAESFCDSD
jgi:hypothetical protein